MAKKLTPIAIQNLKPPPGQYRREIPDGGCTGLYLMVQPVTGSKSWAVRYRYQGRPRKLTLGNGHFLTLAEARQDTRALIGQSARYEPTHTVRRPRDQYVFLFNVHTRPKTCQNLRSCLYVFGP